MASSTAPDASAAMAVDREAEGAGALLGPEEDIEDDVLASLLSTSWPTPAVVDDQYGRLPWTPLGGSLVEQRYDAFDSRRMTSIWTTIRGMYDTLYNVPEGTVTDFSFLRSREDWRVCQVLRHLANREIPHEVGDKANISWDYYPGSPPKLGEIDRGVYVPGALGERTIRTSLRALTLYEQREVRDVPVVRRKALYPTTPLWWEHVEVPRGMAARVHQMVALQVSQLMGEPLGGPYHLMLAALWAFEVADVFLGCIRHHGLLWRLPMSSRSAFADLTPERSCSADPSAQPLLEAGLKLLRLIEEQAPANRLSWLGGPRGVFRCAKALDDERTVVLHEGLGDARLPYGRDIRADTRIRDLDRDLADAASARAGLAVAPEPPSAPAASASAPLALLPSSWGRVSRPAYVSRLASRPARPRRAYPLGGSGGTTATLRGPPGPPLAPLPLCTWDGSAQFCTPSPVNPAIWSSLGRSLGELPSILNNEVDHTLIMALSRTLARLRNEVAAIGSRPLGERDVVPLYHLGTVETLRRYLTEEYGTAVAETNTAVAGWSLRNLSASSAPPQGVALPAAPRRPPSPPPPHYGAGAGSSHLHYGAGAGSSSHSRYVAGAGSSSHAPYGAGAGSSPRAPYGAGAGSSSQALYEAETGPSANPPTYSGAQYYAPEPEEDRS